MPAEVVAATLSSSKLTQVAPENFTIEAANAGRPARVRSTSSGGETDIISDDDSVPRTPDTSLVSRNTENSASPASNSVDNAEFDSESDDDLAVPLKKQLYVTFAKKLERHRVKSENYHFMNMLNNDEFSEFMLTLLEHPKKYFVEKSFERQPEQKQLEYFHRLIDIAEKKPSEEVAKASFFSHDISKEEEVDRLLQHCFKQAPNKWLAILRHPVYGPQFLNSEIFSKNSPPLEENQFNACAL